MTDFPTTDPRLSFDDRISVDCVVFGFDSDRLDVLLVKDHGRVGTCGLKLPGSPIYENEDIDNAARRVLFELTGLDKVTMRQFKVFGEPDRLSRDPEELSALEEDMGRPVGRMISITYIALIKIDRTVADNLNRENASWVPVSEVGQMVFDHNQILEESLVRMRALLRQSPDLLFALLPKKFTILQMRKLCEAVFETTYDPGNFYKKVSSMPHVVPLDEKEAGGAHRAARLYRFDRKQYIKIF